MTLLEDLERVLPTLSAQQKSNDPIVYAKFYIPGSSRVWYVSQGEKQESDFLFFGYESRNHYADTHDTEGEVFSYSFLRRAGEIVGSSVELDMFPAPQPLSKIESTEQ